MAQPEGLLYSKEHEWTKLDGDLATVGITDYAQNSLGDIVYVELPRVGQVLTQHASVGVVESAKAVLLFEAQTFTTPPSVPSPSAATSARTRFWMSRSCPNDHRA